MKAKIIIRVDTDDAGRMGKFQAGMKEDIISMPISEGIRVYVIKENGDVTELK